MVRGNHLDTHLLELGVQLVAVVGSVTDQAFGDGFQESRLQGLRDELRFMALTTRNPDGDRKTMAV
jgi:hypothetical protein